MNSIKSQISATAALIGMLLSPLAQADVITWGSATNSSNASDVITAGTLVEAVNATNTNSGNIVVNGVTFANSNELLDNDGFAGALAGGTTGNIDYDALLNTFDYGNGTDLVSLIVGGGSLLSGHNYVIQVWFTDLRDCCSTRDMVFGDGLGNTVTVNASTGGYGQYAVGYFSASSQTLTLDAQGFRNAHITGYQIREVPEPSTLALLGLGLTGIGLARRRKQA